ncbi:hypothetical protein C465_05316 [Halorubrum distributum JCM 9100]|uniref:Uncharacterized protein n=2 Tax=Halorubrum distributum TaxID=29283 RepID=M0EUF7_9EURY|nr:hypothetical protein C465_05316 [Halorubrum distributum JCM 9100]ELZ52843.1 hypothetical protein C466_09797 [Halorubrum distributum JCM 10118]
MSPTVDVEIRRNRHGSVLAYTDRNRASRLLANHRAVLQSLYDLVDRRHGTDGDVVARLHVRDEDHQVKGLDLADRFRRDLDADRAISLVEDLRYHAGERELVTDGGIDQPGSTGDEPERGFGSRKGGTRRCVPLTWCADHTDRSQGLDAERFAGKRRLVADGGRDRDDDLARIADALELQNALLLQLVQDRRRDAARNDPNPDRSAPADRATATDVVDGYGDLYGGSVAGWEFDPVSDQVENMGDSR